MAGEPADAARRRRRVVIDTNVLISALLSPHRAASQVVDLALAGDLTALVDDRIVAEYCAVTARARFGFAPRDVTRVLDALTGASEHVAARPFPLALPDADDLPFAEVALAGRADALVTGNTRHFAAAGDLIRVCSPRELLVELQAGS